MHSSRALTLGSNGSYLAKVAPEFSLASLGLWSGADMTSAAGKVSSMNDQIGSADLALGVGLPGDVFTIGASPALLLAPGAYFTGVVSYPISTGYVTLIAKILEDNGRIRGLVNGYDGAAYPLLIRSITGGAAGKVNLSVVRVTGEASLGGDVAAGIMSIAFTWTPTVRRLYVNGSLFANDALAGTMPTIVQLGLGISSVFPQYADGVSIGEMRLGNTLLTAAQAAALEAYRLAHY